MIARELGTRVIETVSVASYHDYQTQADLHVLKEISPKLIAESGGEGQGILLVDDLVDTGKTARACAPCCRRRISRPSTPSPRPAAVVDTYVTEVSQDTWIYFPWDMGWSFQPPITKG